MFFIQRRNKSTKSASVVVAFLHSCGTRLASLVGYRSQSLHVLLGDFEETIRKAHEAIKLMQLWSRMRHLATTALMATLAWGGAAGANTFGLQLLVSGLTNPVALANAGDGSNRLFIVDQTGIIKIYDGTQVLATPFLNITSKVLSGGERGLLGLAFDANYASNGFFYVFYTSQPAGDVTIARYSVTADPSVANPNSEAHSQDPGASHFRKP